MVVQPFGQMDVRPAVGWKALDGRSALQTNGREASSRLGGSDPQFAVIPGIIKLYNRNRKKNTLSELYPLCTSMSCSIPRLLFSSFRQ